MNRRARPATVGWRKHLDGWQVGVVLVTSAIAPALLAVPHATISRELPMPSVNRTEQARLRQTEADLATRAPLPYIARSIGEALRRYGALRAQANEPAAEEMLSDLRDAVHTAWQENQAPALLQLRAVQARLFVAAANQLDDNPSQRPTSDLLELGGEFAHDASEGGWLGSNGLLASEDELRTWFVIRWNTLTELSREPRFAPSLNEWRCYYRFLLRADHEPPGVALRDVLGYRGRVIAALAQKDPDYPIDLALGLLSCQQGELSTCADMLSRYLQHTPEGPWSLRVRNTLTAASEAFGDPASGEADLDEQAP
jgi:hypothetical protein